MTPIEPPPTRAPGDGRFAEGRPSSRAPSRTWHLITGEYPPDPGGVADYSALLARALTSAGQAVHVWCPGETAGPAVEAGGPATHRLAGRFGPAGLARVGRELGGVAGPRTILVQYTPHAFGLKAMNLPFALWVARRSRRGDDVRVMFHEVAFPWVRRPLRHNVLAAVHRSMAAILIRNCSRAYVSTESWMPILRRLGGGRVPVAWAPVPSNVPAGPSAGGAAGARSRLAGGDPSARLVGHFGTYGGPIASLLAPALATLLARRPEARAVLLGSGSERWRDELVSGGPPWSGRVLALGSLPAAAVSESLSACEMAIQPYPDGASSRRGSLMAALANGVPVLTTLGPASEPIWSGGSVATAPAGGLAEAAGRLLDRPAELRELGRAGRRLYEERFAIERTVDILLRESPGAGAGPPGALP